MEGGISVVQTPRVKAAQQGPGVQTQALDPGFLRANSDSTTSSVTLEKILYFLCLDTEL